MNLRAIPSLEFRPTLFMFGLCTEIINLCISMPHLQNFNNINLSFILVIPLLFKSALYHQKRSSFHISIPFNCYINSLIVMQLKGNITWNHSSDELWIFPSLIVFLAQHRSYDDVHTASLRLCSRGSNEKFHW